MCLSVSVEHDGLQIKDGILLRLTPLGQDRDYRRYWVFKEMPTAIYVEPRMCSVCHCVVTDTATDDGCWGKYVTADELDGLLASLNSKV